MLNQSSLMLKKLTNMQDYISDWFIPMDFGNDLPDEEPNGEDNFNFD